MDNSNQPTLQHLNVIGEMGLTPLQTRVHPMGGHPSDSSSDDHMPSLMLRLTYSNPQAARALVGSTYRPLTTQQHPTSKLRMQEGFGRSDSAQVDPNRSRLKDAVECMAIDGSAVRRVRVVDFQMDASLAMAQLGDSTETLTGYRAPMEEITNVTIMAIHQLRQRTDGVRQTTMHPSVIHWSEGNRLHLSVAELKDQMERVIRQVETLSGAQACGHTGLDNRNDFIENQQDFLKSGLAALVQEIAGLSEAQGDYQHDLGEVQA